MSILTKETTIIAAQLEQLIAVSPSTLIASSFAGCLLAYMQRGLVSRPVCLAWLSALLLANVVRFVITIYQKNNPTVEASALSLRLMCFRLGVFVTGAIWGSSSFFMFPDHSIQNQLFLIYILTGLSTSAVISYSIDRVSALMFTLLCLVPVLVVLFVAAGDISMAMFAAGLAYVIYMLLNVGKFHRRLVDSVVLRQEAQAREQEVKQLAFYDALTGLPNRRLLLDRINHALALTARSQLGGALLFIDLDHFKTLNDTFGHDMGDLLLKQVAERLTVCVRDSDTVARLGGDEFVVMIEGLSAEHDLATQQVDLVTQQIIHSLNKPFKLNDYEFRSTPSIGVAMFGQHGDSYEDLLKHADIAMYQAKKAGRNLARMFDYEMRDQLQPQ